MKWNFKVVLFAHSGYWIDIDGIFNGNWIESKDRYGKIKRG